MLALFEIDVALVFVSGFEALKGDKDGKLALTLEAEMAEFCALLGPLSNVAEANVVDGTGGTFDDKGRVDGIGGIFDNKVEGRVDGTSGIVDDKVEGRVDENTEVEFKLDELALAAEGKEEGTSSRFEGAPGKEALKLG